jgi:TonB-linked SusC/RagA family outer membrane protein
VNSLNPIVTFAGVKDFTFIDNNWTDMLFGNSASTQHNLAVSGGSEKNKYRLSAGYMYNGSPLQWGSNSNQRFNLRLTNTMQVSKRFKIESMIAYNRQDQVSPSMIHQTLDTGSFAQPGIAASTIDGKPYAWANFLAPIWYAELGGDNKLEVSEVNIAETLHFNLMEGLDLVGNLGYNRSNAMRDTETLAITAYNYKGTKEETAVAASQQSQTSYTKTSSRRDFYSFSGYLNYKTTIAEAHNLTAMAGMQYELTEYDYFGASVKDIQASLETINGAGAITLTNNRGTKWHEAILSYYARLNYDYSSKYLLEGTFRYDGSSKFTSGRWSPFFGVSAGWRISEERFMDKAGWIDDLKLRLSYGVVGNQSGIDRYEGQQLYNFAASSGALLGSGRATIINTIGRIASSNREWERIQNYNVGLDFTLFGNKLTGTVEYFQKRNNNMLIVIAYPGLLGDGAGYSNKGKFKAWGYEGQLMWSDRIGEVSYRIGGTFTKNDNKMTYIGGTTVLAAGYRAQQQGYALNSIFGYEYDGKIQTEEERQAYLSKYADGNTIGLTSAIRPGDNKFKDLNGDGLLTEKDLKWLGSDDPKLSYSINAGISWRGFDLSVIFQGAGDRTIFRDEVQWRIPMRVSWLNTSNQSLGKTWSPEQPNAFYPTYTNNENINNYNYQASSWSVENGAYLRMKDITLGYTVPQAWLKKTRFLSNARLYITGTDLWETMKIHDGWDPESSRTVRDAGRYPFLRSVTFGVNLTF